MSEIKLPKMNKPPMPADYRLPDYNGLSRNTPPLAIDNITSTCFASSSGNTSKRDEN